MDDSAARDTQHVYRGENNVKRRAAFTQVLINPQTVC